MVPTKHILKLIEETPGIRMLDVINETNQPKESTRNQLRRMQDRGEIEIDEKLRIRIPVATEGFSYWLRRPWRKAA